MAHASKSIVVSDHDGHEYLVEGRVAAVDDSPPTPKTVEGQGQVEIGRWLQWPDMDWLDLT